MLHRSICWTFEKRNAIWQHKAAHSLTAQPAFTHPLILRYLIISTVLSIYNTLVISKTVDHSDTLP